MISNIVVSIIIIINILLCFVVLPVAAFYYAGINKKMIAAFVCGAVIYFVNQRILSYYFIAIVAKAMPNLSMWTNIAFNAIFMGVTISVFSEFLRFIVLLVFQNDESDNKTIVWNTMLGIGQGWFAAIYGWGSYMLRLLVKIFTGQIVYSYDIAYSNLACGMLERVLEVVLFVGLTYFIQSTIKSKQKIKTVFEAVILHSIAKIMFSYMQYLWCFPRIVVIILYSIIVCAIFLLGYRRLKNNIRRSDNGQS